ncbi:hypothetical protein SDC9_94408 [bioreactor metagenome]|uniref:Uncharacterized protein n=1 Tax=bioreactor metagenome TaxID=1076179 RepID=A0A645A3D6_9ZZZZ
MFDQDTAQNFQRSTVKHRRCRIIRVCHDNQFCPFGNRRPQVFFVDLIMFAFGKKYRYNCSLHDLDIKKIIRITRCENDHFITGIDEWQHRKIQTGVRTGCNQDVTVGIDGQPVE